MKAVEKTNAAILEETTGKTGIGLVSPEGSPIKEKKEKKVDETVLASPEKEESIVPLTAPEKEKIGSIPEEKKTGAVSLFFSISS